MSTELAEIDAPPELKQLVNACVQWSEANVIATVEDYHETARHLIEVKRAQKAVSEHWDPMVQSAGKTHKLLCRSRSMFADPLKHSEAVDKGRLHDFDAAEKAKAEAERRRLQAIADESARREREKAEQAAAKQRAIEAEERAKAEAARREAEAARLAAESASAAKRKTLLAEADASRREADASDRRAAAAVAKAEVKEEAAAAVVAPVVSVASAAPKANGISTRKSWKAELVDLPAFLIWACRAERYDLLLPNLKVIEAIARGLKEAAVMPGVRFYEESTMAASGR